MTSLDLDRLEELAKKATQSGDGLTLLPAVVAFRDEATPQIFLALIERLRRAEKMLEATR